MKRPDILASPNRIIGLDIDGVIANINNQAVKQLNITFARSYNHDSVVSWDWVYEEAYRLHFAKHQDADAAKDVAKRHRAVYFDSMALRQSDPYPGAVLMLWWLEMLGVPYHFITTRKPENAAATHDWFGQHLPWVASQRIHIRDNTQRDPNDFKRDEIKTIGAGLFFEDNQETAAHLKKNDIKIALVSRSWNSQSVELNQTRVRHGALGIFNRALIFTATGR